jgi:ribosomal protein S18 acetylase RimI-like enzyme
MIVYESGARDIGPEDLVGFFDGWPTPPSPKSLLRILQNSALAILAREGREVVGFINALSDGVMAVYIPLLEVRASHRHQGIGTELVRRVVAHFDDMYMIDVVCDADVAPFYERLGMGRLMGMAHRNRSASVLGHGADSP